MLDGVVAEDFGVGDEGVPGEPDEVGELVEAGDVLGDFGGGHAAAGDFVAGADGEEHYDGGVAGDVEAVVAGGGGLLGRWFETLVCGCFFIGCCRPFFLLTCSP